MKAVKNSNGRMGDTMIALGKLAPNTEVNMPILKPAASNIPATIKWKCMIGFDSTNAETIPNAIVTNQMIFANAAV
jgi:hypothetical protein